MPVRPAAVSGLFYPSDPVELTAQLDQLMGGGGAKLNYAPTALIVPHAGYIYSGEIAGQAYELLKQRDLYQQILLIGPPHRIAVQGMVVPSVTYFATPLGHYPLEAALLSELVSEGWVSFDDSAHELEHSLEVQIPFLQRLGFSAPLIPVIVGARDPRRVASLIDHVVSIRPTLILISSDLSHFHDAKTAEQLDAQTTQKIVARDYSIKPEEACGSPGINGLLYWLQSRSKSIELIAQRNSGDIPAGDRGRVVGYGAYVVY